MPRDGAIPEKLDFETVVISDVHLGLDSAEPLYLAEFLNNMTCRRLIVNGDFFDMWELAKKKNWKFKEEELQALDAINRKMAGGVDVIFIPGNHDEAFRESRILGTTFTGIRVFREFEDNGVLFRHGDEYDGFVRAFGRAMHWAANSSKISPVYHGLLKGQAAFFRRYPVLADKVGFVAGLPVDFVGLAYRESRKGLAKMFGRFDSKKSLAVMLQENPDLAHRQDYGIAINAKMENLAERGIHTLVCGHSHVPGVKKINGITYANSGDWVENGTALVFGRDGKPEVLDWKKMRGSDKKLDEQSVNPDIRRITFKQVRAVQRLQPGISRGPRMPWVAGLFPDNGFGDFLRESLPHFFIGTGRERLLRDAFNKEAQIEKDRKLVKINQYIAGEIDGFIEDPHNQAVRKLKGLLKAEFNRHKRKASKHNRLESLRSGNEKKVRHHRLRAEDHGALAEEIDAILDNGLTGTILEIKQIFLNEAKRLEEKIERNEAKLAGYRKKLKPWKAESERCLKEPSILAA